MRTLAFLIAALAALPASAAPEDRGRRGFFVGAGGGLALGTAVDEDDRRPGSFTGTGGYLRLGEEAIPGLTFGLLFIGSGGSANNDAYDVSGGGFALEVTWRPVSAWPGFLLSGGTGLGGAALEARTEAEHEGFGGGAFFALGAAYEIDLGGSAEAGFVIVPTFHWLLVPDTAENPVQTSTFLIGVGTTWYAGR